MWLLIFFLCDNKSKTFDNERMARNMTLHSESTSPTNQNNFTHSTNEHIKILLKVCLEFTQFYLFFFF